MLSSWVREVLTTRSVSPLLIFSINRRVSPWALGMFTWPRTSLPSNHNVSKSCLDSTLGILLHASYYFMLFRGDAAHLDLTLDERHSILKLFTLTSLTGSLGMGSRNDMFDHFLHAVSGVLCTAFRTYGFFYKLAVLFVRVLQGSRGALQEQKNPRSAKLKRLKLEPVPRGSKYPQYLSVLVPSTFKTVFGTRTILFRVPGPSGVQAIMFGACLAISQFWDPSTTAR